MAGFVVTVKIDPALYGKFVRGVDGVLPRYMRTRATVVQLAAIRDCPKETLKLSESIVKRDYPTLAGGYAVSIVAAQPYAIFVHDGTGIYGPTGQRIYPKTAKALRWMGRDGAYVFATSTRGIRPTHFLSDNLPLFFGG